MEVEFGVLRDLVVGLKVHCPYLNVKNISTHQTQLPNQINPNSDIVNWTQEALKGNLKPAIVMLHKKEIDIDKIVDLNTGNTLLHIACMFGYMAPIRCLIENFMANPNIKNADGLTPFHIVCKNGNERTLLFLYFIKIQDLDINVRDRQGISPLFFTISHNFHYAFFLLIQRGAILHHTDNNKNNIFYYALTSENKIALKFIINHVSSNINSKYFTDKDNLTLSDLMIKTQYSKQLIWLCKYYLDDINLSSIIDNANKEKSSFEKVNVMNYELFNMVMYIKLGQHFSLLKKILFNFRYKGYILYFWIWHTIKSSQELTKFISFFALVCFKLTAITYFALNTTTNTLTPTDSDSISYISSLFSFIYLVFFYCFKLSALISTFMFFHCFYKLYKDNIESFHMDKNSLTDDNHVLKTLYEVSLINQIDIFFEERICEVCLIRKEVHDNHCDICKVCVKNFFFHSNYFNRCVNKKNVFNYILMMLAMGVLNLYLFNLFCQYLLSLYPNYTYSDYSSTNFIFLLMNTSYFNLAIFLFLLIEAICYFQIFYVCICCLGYNTTYYNIFRYHKKVMGTYQSRTNFSNKQQTLCNIPECNVVTRKEFMDNLISSFKNRS